MFFKKISAFFNITKNKIKTVVAKNPRKAKRIFTAAYCILLPICYEFLLRLRTEGDFNLRFFYIVMLSIPVGAFLFLLTGLFNKTVNKIVFNLFSVIIALYFIAQTIFFTVFRGFFSISSVAMGGDAVANFGDQTISAAIEAIPTIIMLLLVAIITIVMSASKLLCFDKMSIKHKLINVGSIFSLHIICLLILLVGGTEPYSMHYYYHSDATITDSSIMNLGVITTTRLELQHALLRDFYTETVDTSITMVDQKFYSEDVYNVIEDIDLNDILKKQKDHNEATYVTAYFAEREPTKKNEYTGYFKDKNLITICAESYSPYLIDPEITPTLYKLSHEGFVFNNFYNSFESNTTNGEYTFCMGMFPDLSRSKEDGSFIASKDNELPFVLANMFNSVNADTYAYHNFVGTYYSRYLTHPNMGYDVFVTPDNGMDIAPTWPSSDYDMMVESIDDYINSGNQFHAYYMTFSGHYQYNWQNVMDAKNRGKVKDLEYSEKVKCYIAGNLELEKALTYLVDRLEEAGIADDTVIVLTADHYPYGLSDENYNELAGFEVDKNFEMYRSSFICWNGGMEKPVVVDDLCSTIDILPTLLNLFGFRYDSRFIMGRDILSDSPEVAIISNHSFITQNFRFDAVNNKDISHLEDKSIDEELVDEWKKYVSECIAISKDILDTNYYQYIIPYLK